MTEFLARLSDVLVRFQNHEDAAAYDDIVFTVDQQNGDVRAFKSGRFLTLILGPVLRPLDDDEMLGCIADRIDSALEPEPGDIPLHGTEDPR